MIVRIWHGRTAAVDADRYAQFMIERAAPDYGAVPGLVSMQFLRRVDGDIAHFLLLTCWESMDAVRRFAGEHPEQAKYYAEDDAFLLDKESESTHYEVFFARDAAVAP